MAGDSGNRGRGKGRGGRGKKNQKSRVPAPEPKKKRKLSESSASSHSHPEKSAKKSEKDTPNIVEDVKETESHTNTSNSDPVSETTTTVPLVKQAIIHRNETYNKIIKDVQNLVEENKGLHEKIENLQNMIKHRNAEIQMLKSTAKEGVCTKCSAPSPGSRGYHQNTARLRPVGETYRKSPSIRSNSNNTAQTEEPSSTTSNFGSGVNPIPFAEPFHDHALFQRHSQEQIGPPVVPVAVTAHQIRKTVDSEEVHSIIDDDEDSGTGGIAVTPPEKRHQIISIANKDDDVVVLDDDDDTPESGNLQQKINDIAKMDRQRLGLL